MHEEREETREAARDWASVLLTGQSYRPLPLLADGLLGAGSTNELDGIPGVTAFASNP